MENIIYKKLVEEVSIKFKKNLTGEEYTKLLPFFLDYIDFEYGNMLGIITDENNSFYQQAIRGECLKICELSSIDKKALLVKDNSLYDLALLSINAFDKAKQKLNSGVNTIRPGEADYLIEKANKLYKSVEEYNKEKAGMLLSEMELDLNYCYNDTDIVSLRLSNLLPKEEDKTK